MYLWKSKFITSLFKPALVVGLVIGLYFWNDKTEVRIFDEHSYHAPKNLDDAFQSGINALGMSSDVVDAVSRKGVGVSFSGRILDGRVQFNFLDEALFFANGFTCVVYEIQLSTKHLALMKKALSSGDDVKGGGGTLARMVNICAQYNSLAPSAVTSSQIIGYKEVGVIPIDGNPWSDPFHGSYWWFIPIVEKEMSDGTTIKLVAFNQRDWAHPVRIGR